MYHKTAIGIEFLLSCTIFSYGVPFGHGLAFLGAVFMTVFAAIYLTEQKRQCRPTRVEYLSLLVGQLLGLTFLSLVFWFALRINYFLALIELGCLLAMVVNTQATLSLGHTYATFDP
jgi:hypothetical protein